MYLVRWTDYTGETHEKKYKTFEYAIKKAFAVHGWYKNHEFINLETGNDAISEINL